MPVYHSKFNDAQVQVVAGLAILPIKTNARGPAPPANADQEDIVDEIIDFFRANVLFNSFEIKGPADRVLVYGTLFLHKCLVEVEKARDKQSGLRSLTELGTTTNFSIPGDSSFPLTGMFPSPGGRTEVDTVRLYFKQLRGAIATRLADRIFDGDMKNKWWMMFSKRKFMNKVLVN